VLKELFNNIFRPVEFFQDGSSVLFVQKEGIRYQDGKRRYIDFDIEFDNHQFVVIGDSLYWKGELSSKIENTKIPEIKERLKLFCDKRGIQLEIR